MKVFVAGATGAIGRFLIPGLIAEQHTVFAMVRSAASSAVVAKLGAEAVVADALDAALVRDAVLRTRPHVIINELTSLPRHYTPEDMKASAERDAEVRLRGNENLLAGAREVGIQRFIVQSAAFWYAPGEGLADENEPFAFDASPGIAAGTRHYQELESSILDQPDFDGIALRYGFFYGPGTWFAPDGDVGEQVRQRKVPIIGEGQGVSSWVHIEDAAATTVAALHCSPGAYNVVDDNPSKQRDWLRAFARRVGAPEPPQVTEEQALQAAGADAVYYATRLRGASNAKVKRELGFKPRRLEWLD